MRRFALFQPPTETKWNDYVYGISVAKDGEKWVIDSSLNSQFAVGDIVVSIDGKPVKPDDDLKTEMEKAIESQKEKTRFVVKRLKDATARKKQFDTLVLQVEPKMRLDVVLSFFEKTVDEVEGGTAYTPKMDVQTLPVSLVSTVVVDKEKKSSLVLFVFYIADDWIFMKQSLFKLGDKTIEHALIEFKQKAVGGSVSEIGMLVGENAKSVGDMVQADALKIAVSKEARAKMILRVKGSEGNVDHEVTELQYVSLLAAIELDRLLKQKERGVK